MLMQILRLEMPNGDGIYRNAEKSIWKRVTKDFEDTSLHPLPHLDPKLRFDDLSDYHYIFGFESVEHYHKWVFNPYWRIQLGKLGAVLSTYEIDSSNVRQGLSQLIFKRSKAKLLSQVDPFFFK